MFCVEVNISLLSYVNAKWKKEIKKEEVNLNFQRINVKISLQVPNIIASHERITFITSCEMYRTVHNMCFPVFLYAKTMHASTLSLLLDFIFCFYHQVGA